VLADEFDDGFDSAHLLSGTTNWGKLRATKARLSMNVWGVAWWRYKGSICSGEDGGADAKDVARDQGIWQRAREGCIAMDGGDAD
jgi:hypothetical protein